MSVHLTMGSFIQHKLKGKLTTPFKINIKGTFNLHYMVFEILLQLFTLKFNRLDIYIYIYTLLSDQFIIVYTANIHTYINDSTNKHLYMYYVKYTWHYLWIKFITG